MKRFILLIILANIIFLLSGCNSKASLRSSSSDPLNLFNDGPVVTLSGGTPEDPLNLFSDKE